MTDIDFQADNLVEIIESLQPGDIDRLPFGTVKLNERGEVVVFSEAERRLSGYSQPTPIGLDFFKQVAPCLDTPAYGKRLEAARRLGRVNLEFGCVGDFSDRNRELDVRLISASDGGVWIFTRRLA